MVKEKAAEGLAGEVEVRPALHGAVAGAGGSRRGGGGRWGRALRRKGGGRRSLRRRCRRKKKPRRGLGASKRLEKFRDQFTFDTEQTAMTIQHQECLFVYRWYTKGSASKEGRGGQAGVRALGGGSGSPGADVSGLRESGSKHGPASAPRTFGLSRLARPWVTRGDSPCGGYLSKKGGGLTQGFVWRVFFLLLLLRGVNDTLG